MELFEEKFDETIFDIDVLYSDVESDILIVINENYEIHMNIGQGNWMIDNQSLKFEENNWRERVKVHEVLERWHLKNKRELLEQIIDGRSLRKTLFTYWCHYFVDLKCSFHRFLSTYILSPCNPTQLNLKLIFFTNWKKHWFKRKLHIKGFLHVYIKLYMRILIQHLK